MFQAAFAWTGDLSKFSFNADTISLNAPAETSDAYISDTSSVVYTAVWQCNFKFDFASSSSNYIKWYLFSDSASLKGELHGYFIRIGYTDKNISLCRQSGTSISVLAQGNEKRVQENAPIYIKVSRDEFGVWSVYSNIETDADTLLEFTVTDNTFERAKFSGFYLKYSSTRSKGYSMWGLSCKGEPYKEFPKPKYREIVINEILSYPYTEGYDFVEIFNNSDSTFNLADITLGNGKTEVTLPSKKFYSGEYKVFTQDSASLEEFYNCTDNAIIELKIPSYVKDSGSVVLRCGTVLVDSVYYNAKTMHSPMLSDVQGVSFERVNPNIDVWASAAENVGFATPGYENSQYKPIKPIVKTDKTIWVEPATFTPNGDGRDDLAMIYYKLDESAVANIAVYNTDGVLVKVLCNRMFLSPSGIITWNGFSDRNMLMPFGIYVVIFEVFNNSKVIMKKKVPFVLGR
ncbi:MAG: lamin tail domain-containing protein [Paludibacteraceae bacterium]|nr:lamin tail domain-containing protein [Paludibacteraceae bacterium]